MRVVAVDTCWFKRPSEVSPFRALLGVAITIKNREEFRETYDRVLDECFEKYGAERKKRIYKAAHITEQLLHNSIDFIRIFIQKISSELDRINVYYTYYPPGSIAEIWTCRDSHSRSFPPEKFMDLIYNAYPHYCVWKYLDIYTDCKHYNYEIDYFHGKISPAWEYIKDLENLTLYHKRSECNKAISTSDFILRHINNTLPGRLGIMNLRRCLNNIIGRTKLSSYFMGPRSDYLQKTPFTSSIDIDTRSYIARPIYWIAWKGFTGSSDEKKLLEWNPIYNNIMDLAEQNNGCVRFYEPSILPHLINESKDKLCLLNEEAIPIQKAIQSIAPEIEVIDFRS